MHNWNTEKIHWIMADGVSQLSKLKKETDDSVIDYDEKVEEQNSSNNDRRSVSQKLKMLVNYWRKQVYVNMHLRELEDEGEADI